MFGLIIPIILFYLSFGVSFAYFTASAKSIDGEITTGIIKVAVTDEDGDTVSSASYIDTYSGYLLPGGLINIAGYLKNGGTVPMYALLEVAFMIENGEDNEGNKVFLEKTVSYYTVGGADGEECDEMVLGAGDRYTTSSTVLQKDDILPFSITYTISGEVDETDAGKEVRVKVVARALQFANVADGVEATNILLGKGANT